MIIVFEKDVPRLERCLAGTTLRDRKGVRDWRELERMAPFALCSAVLIEWLHEGDDVAALRRFRQRYPSHPIVLVTRGSMENARHLRSVQVEEVVWLDDLETALPEAIRRATSCGPLHALSAAIGGAQHLPRTLREALVHACLAPHPVYSVMELAASVHCDRTTLCLQWRKAAGADSPLRLVDFLALVLLLHANRLRLQGRKTAEIASELGIHEHTLRRLLNRLVGNTRRRSPEEDQRKITEALDGFVRAHLLRTAPAAPTLVEDARTVVAVA